MKKVLLIGAGFSKNFGGYLAEDVFLKIFNHPLLTFPLKKFLLVFINTHDFELFYNEVMSPTSPFSEAEKALANKILVNIYTDMDNVLQRNFERAMNFSYLSVISFLINNFSYATGNTGYIFSLNQDLLLERLFTDYLKRRNFYRPAGWDGSYEGLLLPFYGPINTPFYRYHKDDTRALKLFDTLESATSEGIDKWLKEHEKTYENPARKVPCLIKLHGSFYWETENKSKIWITGVKEKESHIQSIPVLKLYFEKFKEILSTPEIDIYIIGYSFRDPHINKIIEEACQKGARLVVFDPKPLKTWFQNMETEFKNFDRTWVKKYYNQPFRELFPIFTKEHTHKFSGDYEKSLQELKTFFTDCL